MRKLVVAFAAFFAASVFWFVWMAVDDRPSEAYQSLSQPPPRTLDPTRNAYFLLQGFGVKQEEDPIQAGYQMWQAFRTQRQDHIDWQFDYDIESLSKLKFSEELDVRTDWIQEDDPVARFHGERDRLRGWSDEHAVLLRRYETFLGMPFEEWVDHHVLFPYPNFSYPFIAHRLYIAVGFASEIPDGLDRLEKDLAAWRKVVANARTVLTKVIAARIVSEDLQLVQSLRRHESEEQRLSRLDKLAQPLAPLERSMRLPFQTEFLTTASLWRSIHDSKEEVDEAELERLWKLAKVLAKENPDTYIDPDRLRSATIIVPFQIQKTLNTLARYYEALVQAADSSNGTLPSAEAFGMRPPRSSYDFLFNPVGKMLQGMHGNPSWERFVKEIRKADAHLRAASLQSSLESRSRPDKKQLMVKTRVGTTHWTSL